MNSSKSSVLFRAAAIAAITFSLAVCAQTQTFNTLASFDGANGSDPQYGSLVQAPNGSYFGTTQYGGTRDGGVFFEVTPSGELAAIYNFCSQTKCTDGQRPWTGPLLGTDGNFYGTTNLGGNSERAGTIYEITREGSLTTLYRFCPASPCNDGKYPLGLMQASNGNFYGVASNGGVGNQGTIFEFSKSGGSKLLYSFCSQANCADGATPYAGLMQASNGNLYGTTAEGGAYNLGTVYEISPAGQFRTIHSFCAKPGCADGATPYAALVEDANGNLYGTTFYGGANGYGNVFKITVARQFILVHTFDNTDGSYPSSALILASDGNLYGTTSDDSNGVGTIFQITAAGDFHSLYTFCTCTGANPFGALLQATDGTFYGTTIGGGTSNDGTIFSFSTGLGPWSKPSPQPLK